MEYSYPSPSGVTLTSEKTGEALDEGRELHVDMLLGMCIVLALLVFVFFVICGYAGTVDRIALALHRHAGQVRRMHSGYDELLRTWWQAEHRRGRMMARKGPVPAEPLPAEKERQRNPRKLARWPLTPASRNSSARGPGQGAPA